MSEYKKNTILLSQEHARMEHIAFYYFITFPMIAPDVLKKLKPEFVMDPLHKQVLVLLKRYYAANEMYDFQRISYDLTKEYNINWKMFLDHYLLISGYASAYPHYQLNNYTLEVLKMQYLRKEIRSICDISNNALIPDTFEDNLFEAFDKLKAKLETIQNNLHVENVQDIYNVFTETFEGILNYNEKAQFITAIPEIDDKVQFFPGELTVIAARPGMGKTAILIFLAYTFGKLTGKKSKIYSYEMTKKQMLARLCSKHLKINSRKYRKNLLTDEEVKATYSAIAEISNYVDICFDPTVDETQIAIDAMSDPTTGAIFIDYLQLMPEKRERGETKDIAIGKITKSLKQTALRSDKPVILLSQLSRQAEKRVNFKPALSDLRESGNIEQDADQVIFLVRPEYYGIKQDENGNALDNVLIIVVAKQREGDLCDIYTRFIAQYNEIQSINASNEKTHSELFEEDLF